MVKALDFALSLLTSIGIAVYLLLAQDDIAHGRYALFVLDVFIAVINMVAFGIMHAPNESNPQS